MRPGRKALLLLVGAITCEVVGTTLLDASGGFSRPLPTAGVLAGYAVSVLLFSRALDHGLPLGIAYGTLTGLGLVSATLFGTIGLGQPLAPGRLVGLVAILVGVAVLAGRADRRESS